MKKKNNQDKNYLDYIPSINTEYEWELTKEHVVVIHVEHKGIFAKIAQKAYNRPKVSHISLEGYGNFIWLLIDGKRSIYDIAQEVKKEFGEDAEPLYERIVKYFQILQNNNFIRLNEEM